MAKVFLSYARQDAAKAKSLAAALERSGYDVWWDRRLQGGARFASEIDSALKQADVVVVLWSNSSVQSAWVQDEAASGRDTDRLVPVLLDAVEPPLGFRQFQTIDLSAWRRSPKPPNLSDLLEAVASKCRDDEPERRATVETPEKPLRAWGMRLVGAATAAAVVLMIVGWQYSQGRWFRATSTPTIAVLPFADLSPEKDKSYFAEGVAEAILSFLGREPGIKVIGRTSASQFKDGAADIAQIRQSLGVTHLLEGSARSSGNLLRVNVRLLDASDATQLWSEEYRRGLDDVFAVQDEIGRAVSDRLRHSLVSRGSQPQRAVTGAETYGLYLAGRAKLRNRKLAEVREALELAKQVIASDPNYGPGYALYSNAIRLLGDNPNSRVDPEKSVQLAKALGQRAIQLSPQSAEGYVALGSAIAVEEPARAIEPLTQAVRLDPSNGESRYMLALAFDRSDMGAQGLEHLRLAHEMEPLWSAPMAAYVSALAANRKFDEARKIIHQFASRGGAEADVASAQEIIARHVGDLSEALRLRRLAVQLDPERRIGREGLALMYTYLGLGSSAEMDQLLAGSATFFQLHATGRYDELNQEAGRLGAEIWSHPEVMSMTNALAEKREWALLAKLYRLRRSTQPLCMYPGTGDALAVAVAMALKHTGQEQEANVLLRCVRDRIEKIAKRPVRPRDFPDVVLHQVRAELLALEGRGPEAFRELRRSIHLGARAPHGKGLSVMPAFDALRPTPEYRAVDQLLRRLTAQERSETLEWLRSAAR